jgi:hypothetical protein
MSKTSERLSRIEEHLWPKGFRRDAWMMVDAARDRRIYGLVLECFHSRNTCLFSGTLAPEIQVVAPYLVRLDYDDQKTRRFIDAAWGNAWGVFLKCDTRLEALRRHLHSCLLARDERGKRFLFRYYDPRILKVYLPTCTAGELRAIFGPIETFSMEDGSADVIVDYSISEGRLVQTEHCLGPGTRVQTAQGA